jgi:FRG domain
MFRKPCHARAGAKGATGSSSEALGRSEWYAFLDEVNRAADGLIKTSGAGCDVWFRGHTCRSYPLLPTLLRGYFELGSERTRAHIHRQEHRLYREFAARVREFHGLVNEDWDNLFAMQHCGAPTRLLEWSESLAIAIYFALHRFDGAPGVPSPPDPQDPPCIWILNPYALNSRFDGAASVRTVVDPKELGTEGERGGSGRYRDVLRGPRVSWQEPVAVHPLHRTTRMQLHRSWFTIHGDLHVGLDEVEGHDSFLARVDLPHVAECAAREYLRDCGLDLLSLYRDLPHIGAHLNRCNVSEKLQFVKSTAM